MSLGKSPPLFLGFSIATKVADDIGKGRVLSHCLLDVKGGVLYSKVGRVTVGFS